MLFTNKPNPVFNFGDPVIKNTCFKLCSKDFHDQKSYRSIFWDIIF